MQHSRAQEQFSFAYITAIASKVRIQVELRRLDDDGIDGILISDQGTAPRIEFQAKSIGPSAEQLHQISYPLKVEHYSQLIRKTTAPRILIVMIVPQDPENWLSQDTEQLVTKHCAYWEVLRGRPPTSNHSRINIRIPKSQVFSPEDLTALIQWADEGNPDE